MLSDERPVVPVAGRRPLRSGRFSGVLRVRMLVVLAVGLALLVLVAALGMGHGDFVIPVEKILGVLAGGGSRAERFVVLELRLPRTLAGLLVGAALGLAGALTQTVVRNPLASPDILGVTEGATVGAVSMIVLGAALPVSAQLGLPAAALIGGLVAALVVYLFAYRRGVDGQRLILVGVGVSAMCASITSWLLVVAEVQDAARASVWFAGSLSGRGWSDAVPVAITLGLLLPVCLVLSFRLAALQMGTDTARALGQPADRVQATMVVLAVLLAATATACAGPIGFVALVVPQIARRMVRGSRPPLLVSCVYGALLVVTADLLARTVTRSEQPVGIVTAVLGAPYLLYLLVRDNRRVTA